MFTSRFPKTSAGHGEVGTTLIAGQTAATEGHLGKLTRNHRPTEDFSS